MAWSSSSTYFTQFSAASKPFPGLFSSDLISPIIAASLPESYTVRALQKDDYARGFLDCLRVLTTVGDITEEQWNERYDWMSTQGAGGYYLLVVEDGDRIVGTGALIVERKLYALPRPPNPEKLIPKNK